MNEETRTLPDAIEDEYSLDPPIPSNRRWMKKLHYVEPVIFMTMFSGSIYYAIYRNAIELQYCRAALGIENSTVCLNNTAPYFAKVQKFTSRFAMTQTIMDSILPSIGSVFLGPWSDTFGRRPLMLSASVVTLLAARFPRKLPTVVITFVMKIIFTGLYWKLVAKLLITNLRLRLLRIGGEVKSRKLGVVIGADIESGIALILALQQPVSHKPTSKELMCWGGYVLTLCLWTWGSATNIHPYYFLAFGLPLSFGGGQIMAILAIFCYLCDITTLDMRAQRLGILQGVLNAGNLLGTVLAPYLIKTSYPFAFGICACVEVVKLMYILFVLKESVTTSEVQRSSMSKNPFQLLHIRSLYETCYVKQTSNTFKILTCFGLLSIASMIQLVGELTVFYLFLQKVLGWTLDEYTPLNCYSILSSAYWAFVGTWFLSRFLNLPDLQIIAIVTGLRLIGSLVLAFGRHIWLIYLASTLSSSTAMFGAMIRVFLSRIIPVSDLGKVFSLIGALESISPLFSSLIYNTVYNSSMDVFPNAIFFVSAGMCVVMALCTAKIVHLHRRPPNELILSPSSTTINA